MELFSKKFSFGMLQLLKISLILVSLGAMLTLYQPAMGLIVIMASVFLAIYELSSMWYAYKAKGKTKKQLFEHPPKRKRKTK